MLFPLCRLFFLGHFSFLSCWCQSEVQCLQGVCACCNCIIIAARHFLIAYGDTEHPGSSTPHRICDWNITRTHHCGLKLLVRLSCGVNITSRQDPSPVRFWLPLSPSFSSPTSPVTHSGSPCHQYRIFSILIFFLAPILSAFSLPLPCSLISWDALALSELVGVY